MQAAYELRIADWLRRGRRFLPEAGPSNKPRAEGRPTVTQLIAAYWQDVIGDARTDHLDEDRELTRQALRRLREQCGGLPCENLREGFARVRQQMSCDGISPSEQVVLTNRIRDPIRWGTRHQFVPFSVFEEVGKPEQEGITVAELADQYESLPR